ncbi:MAG TPA: hypothetical protein ENF16_07700, partial [Bacteroidetes bacterium]|nr:hypothetical protein [Bacteroidota bacterium]
MGTTLTIFLYAAVASMLTSLSGLSVDFKGSPFLLIFLIAAGLFWTFVSYRRTLPPSGIGLRLLLGFLRFTALMVLIFLIFEPTISWHRELSRKPLLAVIIDDSASMKMKDGAGDRQEQLAALLSDPAWADLEENYDLAYFAAGDSLRPLEKLTLDNLKLNAFGSDLAAAWENAFRRTEHDEPAACVLISDGGDNAGRDPVQSAGEVSKPIYTLGIGDTAHVRDARIEHLLSGEIAYRGKPSQITVRVRAQGMENQPARLELLDPEKKIIASSSIKLPSDELQTESTLEFTPDIVGNLPLEVQLKTSANEWSTENNLRSLLLEVRENRIRALMISENPNYESMFFQKTTTQNPDLDLTALTIRKNGGVYDHNLSDLKKAISESDVLILVGFPGRDSPVSILAQLSQAIEKHPLPIWFWLGPRSSTNNIAKLCGELPFRIQRARNRVEADAVPIRYYAELSPDDESLEAPLWWDLPPLQSLPFSIRATAPLQTLIALKDSETGQDLGPALISWESGGRRFSATLGSGFWRWSFMSQGLMGGNELYAGLITKVLRWLVASPQTRPLRLSIDKKLFSSGEKVYFNARVFAGDARPVTSAEVEMTLRGPEGDAKFLLEPDKYGQYAGVFQPEGVGSYTYSGLARLNGDTLGTDSGGFLVEAYNIEKETVSQNRQLLERIAQVSGGVYLPADSLLELADLINAPPRVQSVGWSRRFFLNWDMLGILIALLGLE